MKQTELRPFQTQPRLRLTTFAGLVGVSGILACAQPLFLRTTWPAMATIQFRKIDESSGLVRSRQYPGVFWTHNDSGKSDLFAINLEGELIARIRVRGADNRDWEDIALDDTGHLYIGDIGDNFRRRPHRTIYKVREPDPHADPLPPATVVSRMDYQFADRKRDAESLFLFNGDIHIISKEHIQRTTLFRLEPADDGSLTPVPVCALPIGTATGADVSQDGRRLAVCGYGKLWVFELPDDLARLQDAKPKRVTFPSHYQTEACAFDGEDVIITAESREIWRVTADDIKKEREFP
jgi:hypothetical protein